MLEGNTEPVKGARAGSEFLVTSYKFSPLCFLGMGISTLGLTVSAISHLLLDSYLPGQILH